MYNPGIPVAENSDGFAANSKIHVDIISTDGSKIVAFTVTTPWNTIAPDTGGIEGDVFRWVSGNYILMMRILTVNESNRTATFELLSFAKSFTAYFTTTMTGLPASATAGTVLNYTFDVYNNTSSQTSLRWIFGSQEATGTGTFADWIYPEQLESFPPTTIVRNKNCWYENWSGGACNIGQTIMPNGHIYISGNLTVQAPAGLRENATLAVFVLIPNFWKTVNSNSPGGDEYVLSYVGDSIVNISILSDPCATRVCTPDYVCIGCDAYDAVCNPMDPTGPCIQGVRNPTKDSICQQGYIDISSTPSGATITTDNVTYGVTGSIPTRFVVSLGTHSVKLELAGYEIWEDNNIVVNICQQIITINPILIPPVPYELRLKLDNATTPTYVTQTINSFATLFNQSLLSNISSIQINSTTYVQATHEIVIEMQSLQTLGLQTIPDLQTIPNLPNSINSIIPIPNEYAYSQYSLIELPPTWVILFLQFIPVMLWIPLLIVGYILKYWIFVKKVLTPSRSNVILKTCVSVSPNNCADPVEDVIVEYNGETKTANTGNVFTVIFTDVPVTGVDNLPIKAYIPLSPGSKVYKASYNGFVEPVAPEVRETIGLAINHLSERDFRLCKTYSSDNTPLEPGTTINVFYEKTDKYGVPANEYYGPVTVGADGCITAKVPSYYPDRFLTTTTTANNISPNAPSPLPQRGDEPTIKRVGEMKNIISVYTFSTTNNPIVVDNINVINTSTNTIVKTKIPTDSYTLIDEIPAGTYRIEVIKEGFIFSSCTNNCTVQFTADYLQSGTFTIVLESIVKTCDLTIYVVDRTGKPLKTIPSISIDDGTPRIIDVNKIEIKEMVAKSHKFKITADNYKQLDKNANPVTEESRTISCTDTTTSETFQMSQTDEILVPASMELTINDAKGSVSVEKNKSFNVKVTGANPLELVDIKNISTTPDTPLATGTSLDTGIYETTITIDQDTTIDLQAFQGCICGLNLCTCSKNSNIIGLKVGAGEKECLVPDPLGGCLLYKETASAIGMGILVAILGVAALGMVIMKSPAGGERVIVTTPPAYPGGPQQTVVREKTQTVLGKATEKGIEALGTVALVAK